MEENILKRLFEIKEKPGLFIGQKSLINLYHYMVGYHMRDCEIKKRTEPLLNGFQEFTQKRYKIKSCHNWAQIITFFELNDETAFDKFYSLFEEFLKIGADTH